MAIITNHIAHQISASTLTIPITIDSPNGIKLPIVDTLTLNSEQNNTGYVGESPVSPITLISDVDGSTTSIVYNGRLHFYMQEWKGACENVDLSPIHLHTGYSIDQSATPLETRLTVIEARDITPVGAIFFWSGSTVPDHYALCNGQTHNSIVTPNLVDKFILCKGAFADASTTGGETEVTLSDANLPDHDHIMPWGERWREGAPWGYFGNANNHGSAGRQDHDNPWLYTSTTGGNWASIVYPHNNMPPFYALAYIMYTG